MLDLTDKKTQDAIFRYGVIHEIISGVIPRGEVAQKIRELSKMEFKLSGNGKVLKISESTIYRYLRVYRELGIEALKKKARCDKNKLKSFSQEILDYAIEIRKDLPRRTTKTVIDILKNKFGEIKIARSTLDYHFDRLGFSRHQLKTFADKIFMRFESKSPNHLWIGDYHDRNGLLKDGKEVHLSAFIDCKSRYIVHAEYYLKENLFTLEDSFKKATLKNGCPKLIYLDNAKIYHSKRFAYCCLRLSINPPIFSKPYEKESRGKIEKFFGFVKPNFEAEVIKNGGCDTVDELNELFTAFLELRYQNSIHSEIGCAPTALYNEFKDKKFPDINILNELFMMRDTRKVQPKTKTVSILGKQFVTDSFLGNKQVDVHYNPQDLSYVLIYYKEIFIMKALPLEINAKPADGQKPSKSKENSNFQYDYLAALNGKYKKLLKENAALMKCSAIPSASPDTFHFENFKTLISKNLNRNLSDYENTALKFFYETYRPDNADILNQMLNQTIRQYGTDKHLSFYLDFLKLIIFSKRSDEK